MYLRQNLQIFLLPVLPLGWPNHPHRPREWFGHSQGKTLNFFLLPVLPLRVAKPPHRLRGWFGHSQGKTLKFFCFPFCSWGWSNHSDEPRSATGVVQPPPDRSVWRWPNYPQAKWGWPATSMWPKRATPKIIIIIIFLKKALISFKKNLEIYYSHVSYFKWYHVVLTWISINFGWKNRWRYHLHLFP